MADNKIHDASWDLVNSTRDASQVIADTTVTLLDRNMKFVQSSFLGGIEVLQRETDDLQNLAREWGQQVQKQQEAFQQLAYGTMDTSVNFLRAWFSLYRQAWGLTRSTVDREFRFAQDAAQRVQEPSQ